MGTAASPQVPLGHGPETRLAMFSGSETGMADVERMRAERVARAAHFILMGGVCVLGWFDGLADAWVEVVCLMLLC